MDKLATYEELVYAIRMQGFNKPVIFSTQDGYGTKLKDVTKYSQFISGETPIDVLKNALLWINRNINKVKARQRYFVKDYHAKARGKSFGNNRNKK